MKKLTSFQRAELIEQYVELQVDNMDLLFNIHKTCLHSKQVYANSLSLKGV